MSSIMKYFYFVERKIVLLCEKGIKKLPALPLLHNCNVHEVKLSVSYQEICARLLWILTSIQLDFPIAIFHVARLQSGGFASKLYR